MRLFKTGGDDGGDPEWRALADTIRATDGVAPSPAAVAQESHAQRTADLVVGPDEHRVVVTAEQTAAPAPRPVSGGRAGGPKFSIVTPSLNCAGLIRHCIESVLAQGYRNLEHIIVDGASKDGTVEILKQYPHVRWISEPDHGEAEALNKALRLVTGDVIGWLNADDQYVPGALPKAARCFEEDASRHLVYGKTAFIDEQGQPTNWVMPYAPLNLTTLARWFRLDLFQPSIFFSAALFRDVGLFREDLKYGVDYEYWLRIAEKGYAFCYLDHVVSMAMIYRSGGKTETPYAAKAQEWLDILRRFLPRLSVGERIHFWKDFYLFRSRMAKAYYDNAPIPLPESGEACTGLLLAHKEAGFLKPDQILAILNQTPHGKTANSLGVAAEIFRILGLKEECKPVFSQALGLDREGPARPDAPVAPAPPRPQPTQPAPRQATFARSKRAKRRALIFWPYCALPPQTGAHGVELSDFSALRELGFDVTLCGTTLCTDNPWDPLGRADVQKMLGARVYFHSGTPADFEYVHQQERLSPKGWARFTPPSLLEHFRQVFAHEQPDLVLVHYPRWGRLALGEEFQSAVRIVRSLDVTTVNQQMLDALTPRLSFPADPNRVDPAILEETFFAGLENSLKTARREEFDIYNGYDAVAALTRADARTIQGRVRGPAVCFVPALAPPANDLANTYNGGPVLAISDYALNYQAYLYFAARVLPRIRREIPSFELTVVGRACEKLAPVTGVRPLGFVLDLAPVYKEARFAVCPLIGGTGIQVKIVEAMANGLPVIALANVAAKVPIVHGVNGFVADKAEAFAQYAVQLSRDARLCRKLGQAARATIREEFSFAKKLEAWQAALAAAEQVRAAAAQGRASQPARPPAAGPQPPARPAPVQVCLTRPAEQLPRPVIVSQPARSLPKFSIITPSFNCAQYLRCCIESVLAQGYSNFEQIVVDGGSKDGTVEILKSYPHLKWVSEPDKGEANALNKGLRLVGGDIIGWLNADDFYAEGTLHAVAGLLDPAAGKHVVYGKTLMLEENDRPSGLRIPIVPANLYTLMRWYRHLQIYQPSMFLARSVVQRVGAFREDLSYSVDLEYLDSHRHGGLLLPLRGPDIVPDAVDAQRRQDLAHLCRQGPGLAGGVPACTPGIVGTRAGGLLERLLFAPTAQCRPLRGRALM